MARRTPTPPAATPVDVARAYAFRGSGDGSRAPRPAKPRASKASPPAPVAHYRPGRDLAALELAAQKFPPSVIEAIGGEDAPSFDPGSMYWHFRAWAEMASRRRALPDLDAAERIPESDMVPRQEAPACLASDAPADPYPSRAALIRDAWTNHSASPMALDALRAERFPGADPGPFYWAVRLATLLAAPTMTVRALFARAERRGT